MFPISSKTPLPLLRLFAGFTLCLMVLLSIATPAAAGEDRFSETFPEEETLLKIGAELATALQLPETRHWLYREIQASPYVEYRIAFSRVTAPEKSSALSIASFEALEGLSDLELYFPIPAHREAWDGKSEVALAVPVGDGFRIFLGDRSRLVPEEFNPKRPTLILGPSEIAFDDADSALRGAKRTGSYLRQLAIEAARIKGPGFGGPVAGSPVAITPVAGTGMDWIDDPLETDRSQHSFLTFLHVKKDREGFLGGSMEIEVFGRLGPSTLCVRFTGIDAGDTLYFDNETQLLARSIAETNGGSLSVSVYEDDDRACVIRPGDDFMEFFRFRDSDYGRTLNGAEAAVQVMASEWYCGNGQCNPVENCDSCPQECGACTSLCGNMLCNVGETCASCPGDCGACPPGCGNGTCEFGEDCNTCGQDCGTCVVCGNGICDIGENAFVCPNDCGAQ